MIALWWAAALAAPEEAPTELSPVAQGFWVEGLGLEAGGHPGDAAARFRAVLAADPAFSPATLALARVLVAAGRPESAIEVLADRPFDADAVQALAELRAERGDHAGAAEAWERVVALRPEWPGARVRRAAVLVHVDPGAAASELRAYFGFGATDPVADGAGPVVLAVATAAWESRRGEEAADLVEQALTTDPALADALGDLMVRIEVDLLADALADAGDVPPTPADRRRLEAARSASEQDPDEARRILEVLSLEWPRSAEVWDALSQVREAQGDAAGAEAAIRAAIALDPRSGAYLARHGDLLSRWFAGRYDAEAAAAYARALRRAPDDAELWWRRAEAERRAGRWRASVDSLQRLVELDPDGPHAADARRAVAGATLDRDPPPEIPPSPGHPASLDADAWRAWNRALAWRERTEPWAADEAARELALVRRRAPDFLPALRMEAALHAERGDVGAALATWERLRELEPDDPEPPARLAALYARAGDAVAADRAWEQAADAGHPGALLRRARAQSAAWRWWAARDSVRAAVAHTSDPDLLREASAIERSATARGTAAVGGGVAGVGLTALIPAGLWLRRRRGVDLDRFVLRSPGSWRELARLLSAVRHEVLKHHFGLLDEVADALDDRDPEPARFAAERWFGAEGAVARLREGVTAIEALAQRAGVPVNLRWRDPRFRPLLEAVERLEALESPLRSGSGPALADALRGLAAPLGSEPHRSLGELIDHLCELRVDAELLRGFAARAAAEFPSRGVPRPDLRAPEPVVVRMFRSDLEDVVVNLMRNAIEAVPDGGDLGMCVSLGVEVDPVTFVERARLTFADRAPGVLTTMDLRGRHLSRGLGLAVDLVGAAGGAITVEEAPGYTKGVVVRLPRVEVP